MTGAFLPSLALSFALVAGSHQDSRLLDARVERLERRAEELSTRGRDPEARIVLERALRIRELRSGPESLATARVLRSLGDLEARQGKAGTAELLHRRALAIRRRLHGAPRVPATVTSPFSVPPPDRPETAGERNAVGRDQWVRHRGIQAESNLRTAWKGLVEGHGPYGGREPYEGRELPDVSAREAHRMGTHLFREGRYDEAVPHFLRAERIWTRELGPDDPAVLECRWRLAEIRTRAGRRLYRHLPEHLVSGRLPQFDP